MSTKSFGNGGVVPIIPSGSKSTGAVLDAPELMTTVIVPPHKQADDMQIILTVSVAGTLTGGTHVVSDVPNKLTLATKYGPMVFENGTLAAVTRVNAIKKANFPSAGPIADSLVDATVASQGVLYTGKYRIPLSIGSGPIDVDLVCNNLAALFPAATGVTVTMLVLLHVSDDDGTENVLLNAQRFVAQPNPKIPAAEEVILVGAATMVSLVPTFYNGNVKVLEPSANQVTTNEADTSTRISGETIYVQDYFIGEKCTGEINNPNGVTFTAIRLGRV